MVGSRDFDTDHWALFDLDRDFSEAIDLSAEHPEVVRRLQELWLIEAGRNNVMPMQDGRAVEIDRDTNVKGETRRGATFLGDGPPVAEEALPSLRDGFRIAVDAEVVNPASGILFAFGDWNGGYAMYAVGGTLRYTVSIAGEVLSIADTEPLASGRHRLEIAFVAEGTGKGGEFVLSRDGVPVGSASSQYGVPFMWQAGGSQLRLGHDRGFPVCDDYAPPFEWNGTVRELSVQTPTWSQATSLDDERVALHQD